MINRILIGLSIGGAAALGAAGLVLGYSGTLSFGGPAGATVTTGALPYYTCPATGAAGELHHGDRVLVTGLDESGEWVQVRAPHDLADRVWVQREYVDPDEELDLPVASCSIEVGELELADGPVSTTTTSTTVPDDEEPEDDGEPEESTTTTTAPTTTTTAPTTTPPPPTQPPATTTTVAPTTTTTAPTTTTTTTQPAPSAPAFGPVSRSVGEIKEDFSDHCPGHPNTTSTISTTVGHPSGIVKVEFRRRVGSGSWGPWQEVASQGGAVAGQIGPYPPGTLAPNTSVQIAWEFRATPTSGPVATRSSSPSERVTLHYCSLN